MNKLIYILFFCIGIAGCTGEDISSVSETNQVTSTINKRIFVTSSTHKGDFGGIVAGDTICQNLADNAGLNGTFKVLLSTDSVAFGANIQSNGPWYWLDGVKALPSKGDINITMTSTTPTFQDGTKKTNTNEFWTGTTPTGNSSTDNCNNWTSRDSTLFGTVGDPTKSNPAEWISYTTNRCSNTKHLYCVED